MKKFIPAILTVVIIIMMSYLFLQMKKMGPAMSIEKQKEYVNMLLNKGLYEEAAEVYVELSNSSGLSVRQRANLSYLAGNTYLENLRDYKNALKSYLKVKVLTPSGNLIDEVNQKSIECLERLGRSLDAKYEMEQYTSVDKKTLKAPRGAVIVAKIGEREITMDELQRLIKELPPYYQEMFKDKEKQLEFLQQYVATELLYQKAKRQGYDRDKDILVRAFEAKKASMVQKLIKEEVQDKINISNKEIELYYSANKKEYLAEIDGKETQKTLEEVRDKVNKALRTEKEKELYEGFIRKSFGSSDVKIYDDKFETTGGK